MTTSAEASSQSKTDAQGQKTAAEEGSRAEQARGLVRRNAYWAAGLALIPLPGADFLALTAVQVKMLKDLSELYGVKFFEDKAKTIVGSLIAGLGGVSLAALVARSVFKVVPGIGYLVGTIGASAFGGALTLAIGNLFAMHYESGGTLLNFDADQMRAHFRKEFEKAKDTAKHMHSKRKPGAADSDAP